MGDLERAETFARKFAILCDKKPEAHSNLGLILQKKGDIESAKQSFLMALSRDKKHENALVNMGNVFKNEGNHGKALNFYRQALTLNPENSSVWNNLGRLYTD